MPLDHLDSIQSIQTKSLLSYHSSQGRPVAVAPPFPAIEELCWNARYEVQRLLGQGTQGVVYLARREGVDGYHTNVALKLFPRQAEVGEDKYVQEMHRIARQAQRVSQIQHDNIISIRDFVAIEETRVMVMEWVDGRNLQELLDLSRLETLRQRIPPPAWEHLHEVIVTPGEHHVALKPGIAVDILRGCLAGLSSLHHAGIAHCDLKPANIMVKRTGTKKIVDLDSSSLLKTEKPTFRGTPYYMAPEQLEGNPIRLRSDVASLGYLLIELLTGKLLFRDIETLDDLLAAKRKIPHNLHKLLPKEARDDELLFGLISKMIAFDPEERFADADAAELDRVGAVSFHRHLVKTDLDTEYGRELAWWLELLSEHGL